LLFTEELAMAELLLATIKTVANQRDDLVYALKAAAAELSDGRHFPDMHDVGGRGPLLALVLSAIAVAEHPLPELDQEAA
jgi:hypothetical protein